MNKNADELLRLADEIAIYAGDADGSRLDRLAAYWSASLRAIASRPAARPQDGAAGLVAKWREEANEPANARDEIDKVILVAMDSTLRTCADELEAALATQPPARDGGWFAVDVDALMEAATCAVINCNFYAEIDGVAYSRLPTKDMSALGDLILSAIGEKA